MQARAEVSGITAADFQYMQQMIEDDAQADIMGVEAGVGGGFTNTAVLHVLNYKQTMESEDREEWKKELSCKENLPMEKSYRYIEVPQEWEEYYDDDTVLLLNVSIYGTKQEKPNTSIKTLRLLSKGECQTGLFPQQSEWRNDRGIPNTTRLNAPSAARNS
eukprot:scaffold11917_cov69-Skeletonema_dohrnii-CCMP3373.AAC.2